MGKGEAVDIVELTEGEKCSQSGFREGKTAMEMDSREQWNIKERRGGGRDCLHATGGNIYHGNHHWAFSLLLYYYG